MDSHKFYISPIIGEGMVLRFGKGTILWGQDIPDRKVELEFQGHAYTVFADKAGNWKIELINLEPGGPYELVICGSEECRIQQVYVGLVLWLGGQSNMELPLSRVLDLFEDEVKSIHNPYIRQFAVPQEFDFTKKQETINGGSWKPATGENVFGFSATGYFCAAELYERYKMPIGLIHTAVGGSHIEAWLSKEVLLPINRYSKGLQQFEEDPKGIEFREKEFKQEQLWYHQVEKSDKGKLEEPKWYADGLERKDWQKCQIPCKFYELGLKNFSGIIWLYHEFQLTKEEAEAGDVLLRLGTIVDADETYVNGVLVGKTEYYYPPRRYPVKKGILREGKNHIVVRTMSVKGKGRFLSEMPYYLKLDKKTLDISGKWYYKVGVTMEEKKPEMVFFPSLPAGLYHTMIWPLRYYTINAVLFYQGESNTSKPDYYGELFKEMISLWRHSFIQDRLSFVYVQLPNYRDPLIDNDEEMKSFYVNWKKLQDIQEKVSQEIDDVAMITTTDIGQDNELHPQNKKDVGKRLAHAFRKLVFVDKGEE